MILETPRSGRLPVTVRRVNAIVYARRWQPGEQVVLRDIWRGRVWAAKPVTVVQDDDDAIALYMAPGSVWKSARATDGSVPRIPEPEWTLVDRVWTGGGALQIALPGAAHAVFGFWNESGDQVLGWYINLQRSLRRTPLGFDTMDHVLDVVISPDLADWSWKDEGELRQAQARGVFTLEEVHAIWEEAERAVHRMETRRPPFDGRWAAWTPDPTWPVPVLPPTWDASI